MWVRFIVTLVILYLLYRLVKGMLRLYGTRPGRHQERTVIAIGEDLVEDSFCHVHVPVSQALKADMDGKTVYFCSRECLEKYVQRSRDEELR
jgi:uncharacterized protein